MRTLSSIAPILLKDILGSIDASEHAVRLIQLPSVEVSGWGIYDQEADAFSIDFLSCNADRYEDSIWVTLPIGSVLIDFDARDKVLGIQVIGCKTYYDDISKKDI